MRSWSFIAAFFAVTFLFATQCRAQCLVVPHNSANPVKECPLHKSKAPQKAPDKAPEEAKCNHAPQWDADQARAFEFDLPSSTLEIVAGFFLSETHSANPRTIERPRVPIVLRI